LEIDILEALDREDLLFVDVRSPGEHAESSIPGSINIPLFSDSEHHQLGTIYHLYGENEARSLALEFVSPKLPQLVKKITEASKGLIPLLYCKRGGMRSLSLYQVLSMSGVKVLRLKNGYRGYRKLVSENLKNYRLDNKLIILHGLTGVGKTALLLMLEQRGYPVIDLEGLARHRGSVFGSVGLGLQRSQKDFDALLLQKLDALSTEPLVFIEGEGRRIGNIYLPHFLSEAMSDGYKVLLTASLEKRVKRILATYNPKALATQELEALEQAICSLKNRLGRQRTDQLLELLKSGDLRTVVEILCHDYYDRLYSDSRPETASFDLEIEAEDLEQAVNDIIKHIKTVS
jgi:tRNA 2-selenouridine synthase